MLNYFPILSPIYTHITLFRSIHTPAELSDFYTKSLKLRRKKCTFSKTYYANTAEMLLSFQLRLYSKS